jgi:ATP-binding cassette subfamily B multidrug efflux pump
MKKIFTYIRPHTAYIALQFAIKFTGTIMDLLLPWLLSYIIDDIVPLKNIGLVYFYGGLMILCAAAAIIFNIMANRMSIKTSRDITKNIRHDLFEKISYLSCRDVDNFTAPSLISRLTTDTYNVHQMIDRMQRLGIRAPILLLGGILVTLTLEPVLTLVLILILPLLTAAVILISRKGVKLYTETQLAADKLVRRIQETMSGIRIIKALSKTGYETEKFDEVNSEVIRKEQRASILLSSVNPIMNLLLNTGLTLVIIVGAFRVNSGVTLPGKIIAFLSYFAIILNALMMVTRLFVIYSKGAASAKRITEVLAVPGERTAEAAPSDGGGYHIEFRNVRFSYNKVIDTLTDISFGLKRGETLGIIGATGSGKSTVINLLLRFYDADAGDILIDGTNVKNIPADILHTKFGVVFQNDFLFADTIRENIDFGRGIAEDSIKAAAENAQAGFINEKEGGLDFMLTVKGSNLSGGQKQRLLIARALAADPEILILDDSSSALDYLTDAALRKAVKRNFRDTTTVIVAQRVSAIMHAEKIIVLDEGSIIGSGTHEELLASCESYREIYNAQMGDIG